MSAENNAAPGGRGWPTAAQYNEAVQNLRSTMTDEELRGGETAVNDLGLPLLYSGGFADVYRVYCAATRNTWAVKFFTKGAAGLRERYPAISQHLAENPLPFMTEFEYLPEGVRIGGRLYPIVKMRWIEGLNLNQFVAQSLDQPRLLDQFVQLWVKLAERLDRAGIAHADLQHGNVVLVPKGADGAMQLRLIDYDGMYVPRVAGLPPNEVGHASYQHPQRKRDGSYCLELDRFSHLAICCAVRCARDGGRSLWERYDNGENLLFREADFANPGASRLFRELWMLRQPEARTLVGHLALATQQRLEDAPKIWELFRDGRLVPLAAEQQQQVAALLEGRAQATPTEVTTPTPRTTTATANSVATAASVAKSAATPADDAAAQPTPPARPSLGGLVSESARIAQWCLKGVDRMLAAAAGEGNALLHYFFRGIALLVAMLVLPWLAYVGGAFALRTAREYRTELAARGEATWDAVEQAAEQATWARRVAIAAQPEQFQSLALRQGVDRMKQAEEAEAAREPTAALEHYHASLELFATAVTEAAKCQELADLDRQRDTLLKTVDKDSLELHPPAGVAISRSRAAHEAVLVALQDNQLATAVERMKLAVQTARDAVQLIAEGEEVIVEALSGGRAKQLERALKEGRREEAARLLEQLLEVGGLTDNVRGLWERRLAVWRDQLAGKSGESSAAAERTNSLGIRLRQIPAGEFDMGNNQGAAWEKPVHRVRLTVPFYLAVYEVMQKDYFAVMGTNPSAIPGDTQPVTRVSALDADEFCRRLTERERQSGALRANQEYRLPTEAEWEYAARAGTKTLWHWGDQEGPIDAYAWYGGNSQRGPHNIGEKAANPWQLHDMAGNVSEWVYDQFVDGTYPQRAASLITIDPQLRGGLSPNRCHRGGSYNVGSQNCQPSSREGANEASSFPTVGFRVALVDVPMKQEARADQYVVESNGLRLKKVPAGEFSMGNADGLTNEGPIHRVRISRDFYMGIHEVTQAEYEAVTGTNPSYFRGPSRPVENVTTKLAEEFCARLTADERLAGRLPAGMVFRLPTEAEWEYVARAGTDTQWSGGDTEESLAKDAWYAENSGRQSHNVGTRRANAWGFHDMMGNVAEWLADGYDAKIYAARENEVAVDPKGINEGGIVRCVRGGSWNTPAQYCRTTCREWSHEQTVQASYGFRIVLAESPADPAAPTNSP